VVKVEVGRLCCRGNRKHRINEVSPHGLLSSDR
jgi:hypothetical protein